MDPILGQIIIFAGNFAPRGWAFCDGQLLSIAQNSALFSLLGTTYGGDGQTTFALPDLRGRVLMHPGTGNGLSPHTLGEVGGVERNTLIVNNLPAHNHSLLASASPASEGNAPGNVLAEAQVQVYTGGNATVALGSTSIGLVGENQPVPNLQPYLCINAIIATEGVYPSRS
jgi:microcystin-dependent protein